MPGLMVFFVQKVFLCQWGKAIPTLSSLRFSLSVFKLRSLIPPRIIFFNLLNPCVSCACTSILSCTNVSHWFHPWRKPALYSQPQFANNSSTRGETSWDLPSFMLGSHLTWYGTSIHSFCEFICTMAMTGKYSFMELLMTIMSENWY